MSDENGATSRATIFLVESRLRHSSYSYELEKDENPV